MAVALEELTVADSPRAWRECGFAVSGEECLIGEVRIHFAADPDARGIVGWSLSGIESTDLDGLPTSRSQDSRSHSSPPGGDGGVWSPHPNGITALDHVVAISPDLDRTIAAVVAVGLDLRRIREEPTPAGAPRQAFFRLGAVILEVVQEPPEASERAGEDRPAFFWGLALTAPDLERTVAFLGGDRVSEIRDAVQPGRQIATLRRAAGLSVPIALITPSPRETANEAD